MKMEHVLSQADLEEDVSDPLCALTNHHFETKINEGLIRFAIFQTVNEQLHRLFAHFVSMRQYTRNRRVCSRHHFQIIEPADAHVTGH